MLINVISVEEKTKHIKMDRDLKNKVIVITGGAEGIGFEIAEHFLQKSARNVVILDINENKGSLAAETLNFKYGNKTSFIKCDVTSDIDVVRNIFANHNTVDILVNNAGILDETNPKKTIEINVTSVIQFSLLFFEHMRIDKGGRGGTIINLASIYGFRVDQFIPVYQASKFAVIGFTRSLGHDYNFRRTGVRVVAICPGFTKSSLTRSFKTLKDDHKLAEDMKDFVAKQDWQEVQAVGKAAVDVYEKAHSGSAWVIEGGKPVEEVL